MGEESKFAAKTNILQYYERKSTTDVTLRSFSLEQCKHSGTGIRLFNIKQKDNETITICFVLRDLFPFYKPKVLQYHLVVQL